MICKAETLFLQKKFDRCKIYLPKFNKRDLNFIRLINKLYIDRKI